eukprot:gene7133-9734_t
MNWKLCFVLLLFTIISKAKATKPTASASPTSYSPTTFTTRTRTPTHSPTISLDCTSTTACSFLQTGSKVVSSGNALNYTIILSNAPMQISFQVDLKNFASSSSVAYFLGLDYADGSGPLLQFGAKIGSYNSLPQLFVEYNSVELIQWGCYFPVTGYSTVTGTLTATTISFTVTSCTWAVSTSSLGGSAVDLGVGGTLVNINMVSSSSSAMSGAVVKAINIQSAPTFSPSSSPTATRSSNPSSKPSQNPSAKPSIIPSSIPSPKPTSSPNSFPTSTPTPNPTASPTPIPSVTPTATSSICPSASPSSSPTTTPSVILTVTPSVTPTIISSVVSTSIPMSCPSTSPLSTPTSSPSSLSSNTPTMSPTVASTIVPSQIPSAKPTSIPSALPSSLPSSSPSTNPTAVPSAVTSNIPLYYPSTVPSTGPSVTPTSIPSNYPSTEPTSNPSTYPSLLIPGVIPTVAPPSLSSSSIAPTIIQSAQPTSIPSLYPSNNPTTITSTEPTSIPSLYPSNNPTTITSTEPTSIPSLNPSLRPTIISSNNPSTFSLSSANPTVTPSAASISIPSSSPSTNPTYSPIVVPSSSPSYVPSVIPSIYPSVLPSSLSTFAPTIISSNTPSIVPSPTPSISIYPTALFSSFTSTITPSLVPSAALTKIPSTDQSLLPSVSPTSLAPTLTPSLSPTTNPSQFLSTSPLFVPTLLPSDTSTLTPSAVPTSIPSTYPSTLPSSLPTSDSPTLLPTLIPIAHPTLKPSALSTSAPSNCLSTSPSLSPTSLPTILPTYIPSTASTSVPSNFPSKAPSLSPTSLPSLNPSLTPTNQPSKIPSLCPSVLPSSTPTTSPSAMSTSIPSAIPTSIPSVCPSALPSSSPTDTPTIISTQHPSLVPTCTPSNHPSPEPSCNPTFTVTNSPTSEPSQIPSLSPSSFPTTVSPTPLSNIIATTGEVSIFNPSHAINVKLKLSGLETVFVYCGTFSENVVPQSVSIVINKGFYSLSSNGYANVTVDGLKASTSYSIYCATKGFSGMISNYQDMINQMILFQTNCCKQISVSVNSKIGRVNNMLHSVVKLSIDSLPSSSIVVDIVCTSSTSQTAQVVPKSLLFKTDSIAVSQTVSILFTLPGIYYYSIVVNGDSKDEYNWRFASSNFTIIQSSSDILAPPQLSSAKFSDDGSCVELLFDSSTNKGGYTNNFLCGSMLSFSGDSTSTCSWNDDRTIKIYYPFKLIVNSVILLKNNNNITGECSSVAICSESIETSVLVMPPSNPIPPIVNINVQPIVSICSGARMDLTSSTGSAGRPWLSTKFEVISSSSTNYAIVAYLNRTYDSSKPLTIPASLLESGFSYSVSVTKCNFLTSCGSSLATFSVSTSTDSIPLVVVAGSKYRQIFTSQSLVLYSLLSYTPCDQSKVSFTYSWAISETVTGKFIGGSESFDPSKLVVSPFKLSTLTRYEISVNIYNNYTGPVISSYSCFVDVLQSNIAAQISGGSMRTLAFRGSILLDASASYDSDIALNSDRSYALSYGWSCYRISPTFNMSCPLQIIVIGNGKYANVTAENTNITGRVTLTVTSGSRVSSTYVEITVISNVLCDVSIASPSTSYTNVLVNRNLQVSASIRSLAKCNAQWMIDDPRLLLSDIALTATEQIVLPGSYQTINILLAAYSLPEHYIAIQGISQFSYATTVLPSGSMKLNYQILCITQIVDAIGSIANMSSSVNVFPSTNLIGLMKNISNAGTDSVSDLTNLIGIVSGAINYANCSLAPICELLFRSDCSYTQHTCGACLSGYVGKTGDHNEKCFLDKQPRAEVCKSDFDCGMGDICSSASTCVSPKQKCLDTCYEHGSCSFRNRDSGYFVTSCTVMDNSCEAICICSNGYMGFGCDIKFDELIDIVAIRTDMSENLIKLINSDDVSADNIINWSTYLVKIARDPTGFNINDMSYVYEVASTILRLSKDLDSLPYYELENVMFAVDSIFSAVLTSYMDEVTVAYMLNLRNQLILQFEEIVLQQIIPGQESVDGIYGTFRTRYVSKVVSDDSLSLETPKSIIEKVNNINMSFVQLKNISGQSAQTSIKVGLQSTTACSYGNMSNSLTANPIKLSISSQGTFSEEIVFVLYNNYALEYVDSKLNFSTMCDGIDRQTYNFSCPVSGLNFHHNCTNKKGLFVSHCLVFTPSCIILNSTSSIGNKRNCSVQSFDAWSTTCICSNLDSQRRVLLSSDEVVDEVLSVASIAEFIGTGSKKTFEASSELFTAAGLQKVLTVVIMFATFWGFGISVILGCSWRRHHMSEYYIKDKNDQNRLKKSAQVSRSPNAVKEYLMDYVNELFPSVFSSKPFMYRLYDEVKKHHRYLLVLTAARSESGDAKRILTGIQLLSVQTMLMFLLAFLYDLQGPDNDGSCISHTTQESCLLRKSVLDHSQSYCKWQAPPPTLINANDDSASYTCEFREQVFSLRLVLIIAIIVSLFTSLFSKPIDMIFDLLSAPISDSAKVQQEPSVVERVGNNLATTARRVSIAAINLSENTNAKVRQTFLKIGNRTRSIPHSTTSAHELAHTSMNIISSKTKDFIVRAELQRQQSYARSSNVNRNSRLSYDSSSESASSDDDSNGDIKSDLHSDKIKSEMTSNPQMTFQLRSASILAERFKRLVTEIHLQRRLLKANERDDFDIQW